MDSERGEEITIFRSNRQRFDSHAFEQGEARTRIGTVFEVVGRDLVQARAVGAKRAWKILERRDGVSLKVGRIAWRRRLRDDGSLFKERDQR